ncbi:MAG: baseplate J/gp47 family protein [Xanthomonadaceae bacterium]|nr:baseplate J/gp47 family protein [Xanthomonadaceae bacterium]
MSVDLSLLPPPAVVEPLDFESILAAAKSDALAVFPELADVLALESDPVTKLLQVFVYRELLLRARINDSARAVMLASATGSDLDQLAALFGVARLMLDPGDPAATPPVAPTLETDADLRRRTQLAPEGFSVAGPEGAYIFHALSVADVLDASVTSPAPGEVLVSVLSRTGDGTAGPDLVLAVAAALTATDVRPLTDQVTVQSAQIVPYAVTATLWTLPGPDAAVVLATAQLRVQSLVESTRRLGRDIARSALIAALHVDGVQRVDLTEPAADIVMSAKQAGAASAVTIISGGVNV